MSNIQRDIKNAIKDPKVAALGNRGIYAKLKHKYKKKQLMNAIKNVESQQIHYKKNKKKEKAQMTPIRASDVGFLQIDFAEMPKEWTGNVNAKCKYLLVVVDIYSRAMWVKPLPSRNSTLYTQAFQQIINEMKKKWNFKPFSIVADNEFVAKEFLALLKKNNINIIYSLPEKIHYKTAIVERAIGTLKVMINRYLTSRNSRQYKGALSQIVLAYNEAKHSTLGVSPLYVLHHKWIHPPKRLQQRPIDNNLKKGDIVRYKKPKPILGHKGHRPTYTKTLYIVLAKIGHRYKIKNTETNIIVNQGRDMRPKLVPRHQLLLVNQKKIIKYTSDTDSDTDSHSVDEKISLKPSNLKERHIRKRQKRKQKLYEK